MTTTQPHLDLWREPERRRLVRLCATITGDAGAAEDLAQETLLEAWRSAYKLHDPSGADRWLSAIARNVCRRWARRRGRDLPFSAQLADNVPDDVELELERAELAELLDRALAQLAPSTRDVLVARFVDDSPHAEIAAQLGLSVEAVSMRISRGKVVLRRVLAEELRDEPDDGWRDTRVWCSECGKRRLVVRRESSPDALAFRCPHCQAPDVPGAFLRLDNPVFARLVGDLVRPASILKRVAAWSERYFAPDQKEMACTYCGGPARLEPYEREAWWPSVHRRGLVARCAACGEQASSSIAGIALARTEVRAFRKAHPRTRALPLREVEHGGVDAFVVRYEDFAGSDGIDLVFERDTLRVLHAAS